MSLPTNYPQTPTSYWSGDFYGTINEDVYSLNWKFLEIGTKIIHTNTCTRIFLVQVLFLGRRISFIFVKRLCNQRSANFSDCFLDLILLRTSAFISGDKLRYFKINSRSSSESSVFCIISYSLLSKRQPPQLFKFLSQNIIDLQMNFKKHNYSPVYICNYQNICYINLNKFYVSVSMGTTIQI